MNPNNGSVKKWKQAIKAYQEPETTSLCGCHIWKFWRTIIYFFKKKKTINISSIFILRHFERSFLISVHYTLFKVQGDKSLDHYLLSSIEKRSNHYNNDNINWFEDQTHNMSFKSAEWWRLISLECHTNVQNRNTEKNLLFQTMDYNN